MKNLIKNTWITAMIVLLSSGFMGYTTTSSFARGENYSNPAWAPPYYAGVRYYYIPDIEVYYDLSNQDFVYLDDGQWLFSNTLPAMYSNYDLYDCYAVALNVDVYQPWMHNQFYLSNYPRYYYRSLYRNQTAGSIRGFNENAKKPFLTTPAERTHMSELSKNNRTPVITKATRQPQKSNYYGKNIGQPVRVQSQMRQPRQTVQAHVATGGGGETHASEGGGAGTHASGGGGGERR